MFIQLNEATNHTVHISNHGALSTFIPLSEALKKPQCTYETSKGYNYIVYAPSATYHSYSTAKGFEVWLHHDIYIYIYAYILYIIIYNYNYSTYCITCLNHIHCLYNSRIIVEVICV